MEALRKENILLGKKDAGIL